MKDALAQLEKENSGYEKDLEALMNEANELEKKEQRYWERIAELSQKTIEVEEETSRVSSSNLYYEQEYKRLESINVFNDVFKISCPEKIASINGFRLGRLANVEVKKRLRNFIIGIVGRNKHCIGTNSSAIITTCI